MKARLAPLGDWFFRTRNHVFPLVAIAVLVAFPIRQVEPESLDLTLHLAGIGLVLLGGALRAATIGLVYVRRGGARGRIHADELLENGLFAHCRNPLYVGNLLIVAGILVNQNNPWAYLLLGSFFLLAYVAMVAAEERYLSSRFGDDYADYRSRVPRWHIRLAGLDRTLAEGRFQWRRVVVVEYASAALWTTIILLQLGADAVFEAGFAGSRNDLIAVAIGLVLTGIAAYRVRVLKKSGRLAPANAPG